MPLYRQPSHSRFKVFTKPAHRFQLAGGFFFVSVHYNSSGFALQRRTVHFDLTALSCFCYNRLAIYGEVSEWFKEPVLKTGDAAMHRGFESHPLRHMEWYSRG